MQKLLTITIAVLIAVATQAGTVIKTDFADCAASIQDKLGRPNEKISGKVPTGWADDSHWGKATVQYLPESDQSGVDFLRIQVPAPGSGKPAQFVNLNVPDLTEKTSYRIKFRLRNPGQTLVSIGLRLQEKPWSMIWQKVNKFSNEWQDYEFTFTLDKNDMKIGVWINMPPGTVLDLKSFELSSETAK